MHDWHIADHPPLALSRVIPRILRSTRFTPIIRIARTLRNTDRYMVLHMALGIALDIATGKHIVREIAVGREKYPNPGAYPNANAQVSSQSRGGFSKWTTIFPMHLMGIGKHFHKIHFHELQPYKTSY